MAVDLLKALLGCGGYTVWNNHPTKFNIEVTFNRKEQLELEDLKDDWAQWKPTKGNDNA